MSTCLDIAVSEAIGPRAARKNSHDVTWARALMETARAVERAPTTVWLTSPMEYVRWRVQTESDQAIAMYRQHF